MSEANKATVRRLYLEALNAGDLPVVEQIYDDDVELHLPGVPEDPFGPEPVRQWVQTLRSAWPGITAIIEDLLADSDRVTARVSFHRPHDGKMIGVAPMAPLVSWTRIDIFRLFHGRIVEQWADRDDLAVLAQLGIPAAPMHRPDRITATGTRMSAPGS